MAHENAIFDIAWVPGESSVVCNVFISLSLLCCHNLLIDIFCVVLTELDWMDSIIHFFLSYSCYIYSSCLGHRFR